MQHTHFWKSKFRIRIKKTRPTKTGTLRISHTSSSQSLIDERANKRGSFENAKLLGVVKQECSVIAGASSTNLREIEY